MSTFIGYCVEFLPALLRGTVVSVEIFLVTIVISLPLGFPLALARNSRFKFLNFISWIYIWVFRGTPLLLQLFFFYFFLPGFAGIALTAFQSVCLAFSLNYAAYFAEIYRGGINSIDKGQFEAAHSLGISPSRTMFGIILPQTMKAILPPVFNEVVVLVKDTALASVLPIMDLMKATNSAVSRTSRVEPFLIAAVLYLMVTAVLTFISSKIEKHYSKYDAKEEW